MFSLVSKALARSGETMAVYAKVRGWASNPNLVRKEQAARVLLSSSAKDGQVVSIRVALDRDDDQEFWLEMGSREAEDVARSILRMLGKNSVAPCGHADCLPHACAND